MRIEPRKLLQQSDAIFVRFAHAQNSAAAHGDPRVAHVRDRLQPVVVYARRDDVAVKFRRRIEIVVVRRKPRRLSAVRACDSVSMPSVQHTSIPSAATRAHHFQHAIEILVRPSLAATPRPCRIASRLLSSRASRPSRTVDGIHQLFAPDVRLIVRALRTVRAVLRAAARLDRKQPAKLHFVRLVKSAM